MTRLLDSAIARPRAVLSLSVVMALAGLYFYLAMPRKAAPEIDLPLFTIDIAQDGISVEEAERLIIKPLESALRGVAGLKWLTAIASPGQASLVAEFDIGADTAKAHEALRQTIAAVRSQLPPEAETPVIGQSSPNLLPVITVALSGAVPERTLLRHARLLKDRIETLPGVQRAKLAGHREEVVEVIVDPARLAAYAVGHAELMALVRNNRLVAAGSVDSGSGRFNVKMPALFESEKDILGLPVKASQNGVVTLGDIAEARRTFKDATGYTRVNGQPAILLNVVKRPGATLIGTNDAVRRLVADVTQPWPDPIRVNVLFDNSRHAEGILGALEAGIAVAVLLATAVTFAAFGFRSALMVGLAVLFCLLIGILCLGAAGSAVDRTLMFGLLVAVGLLVNLVTILVEFAEREAARGLPRSEAFRLAARQMAWPAASATAATMALFLPLLLWPGAEGASMQPLPWAVIAVLGASLFTALIVLPAIGGLGASATAQPPWAREAAVPPLLPPRGAPAGVSPLTPTRHSPPPPPPAAQSAAMQAYLRLMRQAIGRPWTVLAISMLVIVAIGGAFRIAGQGAAFPIESEPEGAVVVIAGRGNLSAQEELELVKSVEARVLPIAGLRAVIAFSGTQKRAAQAVSGGEAVPRSDQIGQLLIEFHDRGARPDGKTLLEEIRNRTAGLPGVRIEVRKREADAPAAKPLRLEIRSDDPSIAIAAAEVIRHYLDRDTQLRDIEDTRPLPGIGWVLRVDREEASRLGADMSEVGAAIQMVTGGVHIGKFRPANAIADIEIRARFPAEERSIGELDRLTVRTAAGLVPVGNFVTRAFEQQTGDRVRLNQRYMVTIAADTVEGVTGGAKQAELSRWLEQQQWPDSIGFRFRGAGEEMRETSSAMALAVLGAMFLIFIILVAQFDSFYQTAVTLAVVALPVAGVLLGLLVTRQGFSAITTGIALLALTGVAMTNAIILIERFNRNRASGLPAMDAALESCGDRMRPVMLATIAVIAGMAPMALGIQVDPRSASVQIDAAASGWGGPFATALIFGLAFSALLTLVLLPTLLAAPAVLSQRWRLWKQDTIALYADQQRAADRAGRLLKQPSPRRPRRKRRADTDADLETGPF